MKIIVNSLTVLAVLAPTLLAGCTTAPDKISASYVSPLIYQDYSCKQVRSEMSRVSRKVHEVTGVQQKEADGDAVAMGVGLVLFWPALFFLMGEDKKVELGQLKGEYEALEKIAIKKNCNVADQIKEARLLEEERQKEREEKSGASRKAGKLND